MLWLLLLAGGGLAIAASSSASKSPGAAPVGLVRLAPVAPPAERFTDPMLTCTTVPRELAVPYLVNVPNFADARIAAIRARVGAPPAGYSSFPKTDLGAFGEASFVKLQSVSSALISALRNVDDYAEAASKFGINLPSFRAEAASILSAGSAAGGQAAFIERAAQFAPIASTLVNAALTLARGGAFDATAAAVSFGRMGAAALASVVPVIGQVLSLAMDLGEATLAARKAYVAATCKGFFDRYADALRKTTSEGFPGAFHLLTDTGEPCATDGSSYDYNRILFLENAARGNHLAFRAMTPNDKVSVQAWWAIAVTLMSHPLVFQAFSRLGHGAAIYSSRAQTLPFGVGPGRGGNGAFYGGLMASDEQVALVAIPIAIANGLDPWAFTSALWSRSQGWASADRASRIELPMGIRRITNETGDPTDDRETYDCPTVVANAWHLNWAALARDALAMAKTFPKAKPRFIRLAPIGAS
jgi:hypothetical protein